MKIVVDRKSTSAWGNESLIVLVARNFSIASASPWCCFSNAQQSSIHLWGAIALLSSSKSLMSDMGKLGRKRVLSRHTRWSAATQTTRCRVLHWKALQVLITIIHWFEQRKPPVDIPYAVPKYRTDGETCRYWSAHQSKCLRASARSPQPSPVWFVSEIVWSKVQWKNLWHIVTT